MRRILTALLMILGLTVGLLAVAPGASTAAGPGWPVLRQGEVSRNVQAAQYLLNHQGISTGADGDFGPGTRRSVVTFQARKGITQDGIIGVDTWSRFTPQIQRGASGNAVKAAQTLLNKNGASLAVDGAFGDGTRNAVIRFQGQQGLTADGIVGPTTWRYLAARSTAQNPGANCGHVTSGVPISATQVVNVNGYTVRVHSCLAASLTSMMKAASAAGYPLASNSSFRTRDEQIAARRQNCGTSYDAIYTWPSWRCSPATAIPGTSMHERGLAIDFASAGNGGYLSSGAFNWLANNAHRYGLKNLPSERWHWSTTGG